MKNLKKVLTIVLALVMVFSFAACGADKSSSDIPTYKCLTESTFPPFDTVDEDGNIIGFDMDLIAAIGEDQGFNCEFVDMAFDSLIPALESNQGDIITAFMWPYNPERQEKVDFSEDYFHSTTVAIVKAGNTAIKSEDDITTDTKVATQIGTVFADETQKWIDDGKIADATFQNGFDTCVLQLLNGDVDCVISSLTMADEYIKMQEGKIEVACEVMPQISSAAAFAVHKGNTELQEKINAGLKNLVENGKYAEICEKWDVDVTIK